MSGRYDTKGCTDDCMWRFEGFHTALCGRCICTPYSAGGDGPERGCPVHDPETPIVSGTSSATPVADHPKG